MTERRRAEQWKIKHRKNFSTSVFSVLHHTPKGLVFIQLQPYIVGCQVLNRETICMLFNMSMTAKFYFILKSSWIYLISSSVLSHK